MIKYLLTIILTISILSFYSCKISYIKNGVSKIDSLSVVVSEIELKHSSIDSAAFSNKYNQYLESISKIKQFQDTTYGDNEWNTMTLYGQVRKPLRNFIQNYSTFKTEIDYSKKQLADLKYDLENKHITNEKFEEFITRERKSILQFKATFDIHYAGAQSQSTSFDTLYPKILEIIDNRLEE